MGIKDVFSSVRKGISSVAGAVYASTGKALTSVEEYAAKSSTGAKSLGDLVNRSGEIAEANVQGRQEFLNFIKSVKVDANKAYELRLKALADAGAVFQDAGNLDVRLFGVNHANVCKDHLEGQNRYREGYLVNLEEKTLIQYKLNCSADAGGEDDGSN